MNTTNNAVLQEDLPWNKNRNDIIRNSPKGFVKKIPLLSLHNSEKKLKCVTTDTKWEAVIRARVKQMRIIK